MSIRTFLHATLFSTLVAGAFPACSKEIPSYYPSRMNGLARSAELGAAEARRSSDDMVVSAEQLETQLESIRRSTNSAETDARRLSGHTTASAHPKAKPMKKSFSAAH